MWEIREKTAMQGSEQVISFGLNEFKGKLKMFSFPQFLQDFQTVISRSLTMCNKFKMFYPIEFD